MTPTEERAAAWKALLAAVAALTEQQAGAYEDAAPGSGWWTTPYGSSRSPAIYSDDGREVGCVFTLWDADEREKTYRLSIRVDKTGGAS